MIQLWLLFSKFVQAITLGESFTQAYDLFGMPQPPQAVCAALYVLSCRLCRRTQQFAQLNTQLHEPGLAEDAPLAAPDPVGAARRWPPADVPVLDLFFDLRL